MGKKKGYMTNVAADCILEQWNTHFGDIDGQHWKILINGEGDGKHMNHQYPN